MFMTLFEVKLASPLSQCCTDGWTTSDFLSSAECKTRGAIIQVFAYERLTTPADDVTDGYDS